MPDGHTVSGRRVKLRVTGIGAGRWPDGFVVHCVGKPYAATRASTRKGHHDMAEIHGSCDERFSAVSSALAENIDAGEETGASLVVDLDGEIAVDIWGGFRDEARTI